MSVTKAAVCVYFYIMKNIFRGHEFCSYRYVGQAYATSKNLSNSFSVMFWILKSVFIGFFQPMKIHDLHEWQNLIYHYYVHTCKYTSHSVSLFRNTWFLIGTLQISIQPSCILRMYSRWFTMNKTIITNFQNHIIIWKLQFFFLYSTYTTVDNIRRY